MHAHLRANDRAGTGKPVACHIRDRLKDALQKARGLSRQRDTGSREENTSNQITIPLRFHQKRKSSFETRTQISRALILFKLADLPNQSNRAPVPVGIPASVLRAQ